ncbi:MAG: NgoFVII family restriction endonuclease [Ignavibacteriales bacterium]|nr:NgoFVII family restriction endonuclease [Ignavibacteriales bacterium]
MIIRNNWWSIFKNLVSQSKSLKIVSPFISEQIIVQIKKDFDLSNLEMITRYNLRDFAQNVSSLSALKLAVSNGAKVYGVKNLHSKIYMFDNKAIISSANLTSGGLYHNYECGILFDDKLLLKQLQDEFSKYKAICKETLTIPEIENWEGILAKNKITNLESTSFPDYGSEAERILSNKSYYVKIFGTSENRVAPIYTIRNEVDRALCHYACCFSEKKKPRRIEDGDIIFMARLIKEPNDYAIFGRAEAIKYNEKRDRATKNEKMQRDWKNNWPIYMRVKNSKFIDGMMQDGILLYDLIKHFDYESFPSTLERFNNGEREINPYRSLSQKAYVKLTPKSAEWLEKRFGDKISEFGLIPDDFINKLPKSDINI